MSIIIDEEFKNLIPPLTADEYAQLEENCVKEGIRDPLVVWKQDDGNSILIDGHNRFKTIAKHMLHYNEIWMQFKDRDEAKLWIIENQLGRRNLPLFDTVTLNDQKRDILAKQAKEKQQSGKADPDKKSCQGATQKEKNRIDRKNKTDYKIAKLAGTSEDTVRKVRAINESNDEKLKEQIRSGDVSINQGYRIVKGIEDKHPAKAMQEFIEKKKEEHREFKEKKTIGIDEAKADKSTRRFLAMDTYTKLMRMGKQITDISLAIADGDIDLEEAAAEFTEEESTNLIMAIAKWVMQLKTITEVINA